MVARKRLIKQQTPGKRTIYRYRNRKMYDPCTSTYINALDLMRLLRESSEDFEVVGFADRKPQTSMVLCSVLSYLCRQGVPLDDAALIEVIRRSGAGAEAAA